MPPKLRSGRRRLWSYVTHPDSLRWAPFWSVSNDARDPRAAGWLTSLHEWKRPAYHPATGKRWLQYVWEPGFPRTSPRYARYWVLSNLVLDRASGTVYDSNVKAVRAVLTPREQVHFERMMRKFPAYYCDDRRCSLSGTFLLPLPYVRLSVKLRRSGILTMIACFPPVYRLNVDIPASGMARAERTTRMLYGLVMTREERRRAYQDDAGSGKPGGSGEDLGDSSEGRP